MEQFLQTLGGQCNQRAKYNFYLIEQKKKPLNYIYIPALVVENGKRNKEVKNKEREGKI